MRPLRNAQFAGRSADSLRFDFDAGWQCRVFVLADDLVRVLFLRDETLKEPRTWMVAPAGVDVPWEGRDRLDVSAFPRPAFDVVTFHRLADKGRPKGVAAPASPWPS